ncbi:hypothetical protein D9M71_365560 [compost metagenome]
MPRESARALKVRRGHLLFINASRHSMWEPMGSRDDVHGFGIAAAVGGYHPHASRRDRRDFRRQGPGFAVAREGAYDGAGASGDYRQCRPFRLVAAARLNGQVPG